ncbi:hypothetical protein LINPERHAP2_LOCUS37611 [Linum perenne]
MDRLLKQNRQLVPSMPEQRGSSAARVDCSLEMIRLDQLLLEHRSMRFSPPLPMAAMEIRSKVDCRRRQLRRAAVAAEEEEDREVRTSE